MTQTLDITRTVGELVVERPGRARVFEALGIDYCCGGTKPLDAACRAKGIDPADVFTRLDDADAAADEDADAPDPDRMTLTELADHIVRTHHAYLRRELPRLGELTQRVRNAHGAKDARLVELARVFSGMALELGSHMMKEEQILFPMVRQLETASSLPEFHCGSTANPIAVMEHEHQDAGDALAAMRELTEGFTPPPWACNTYRVLLDGLHELEQDLHLHIHKENNILFPRTAAMERRLRDSGA